MTPPTWTAIEQAGKRYLAVDGRGYETLARNQAEILRYAIEVEGQISYYRKSLDECAKAETVSTPSPK